MCMLHIFSLVLFLKPLQWLSGRAFAPHTGDLGSITGHDSPNALKQVVAAPLTNARQ